MRSVLCVAAAVAWCAIASCSSSNTPVGPLSPTYTVTVRIDALSDRPEAAVWTTPESIDVRVTVIDSTASPPAAISVGDVRAIIGSSTVSLPRLANRTTYAGRAPMPASGQMVRITATGSAGRVDAIDLAASLPALPRLTAPDPDSSVFPARGTSVQWATTRTDDAVEVVLRSLEPPGDSFVTRPALDDGFIRLAPEDVARVPPGFASLRVTRLRRVSFTAAGVKSGMATVAATCSERVYILAPEAPRRTPRADALRRTLR